METFPITSDSYSPDYFPLPQQLAGLEFDSLSSSSSSSYNSPASCCSTQPPYFLHRNSPITSDTGNVRRVFSTGDMDQVNEMLQYKSRRLGSPLSEESSASIIESMSKARRYSPEEKKERIERYKSKRSLRNFNKKIKVLITRN